jgi:hypothetical protein
VPLQGNRSSILIETIGSLAAGALLSVSFKNNHGPGKITCSFPKEIWCWSNNTSVAEYNSIDNPQFKAKCRIIMKQKKTIIKVSDILSHAYFSLLAFKLPFSLLFVVSIVNRDCTVYGP